MWAPLARRHAHSGRVGGREGSGGGGRPLVAGRQVGLGHGGGGPGGQCSLLLLLLGRHQLLLGGERGRRARVVGEVGVCGGGRRSRRRCSERVLVARGRCGRDRSRRVGVPLLVVVGDCGGHERVQLLLLLLLAGRGLEAGLQVRLARRLGAGGCGSGGGRLQRGQVGLHVGKEVLLVSVVGRVLLLGAQEGLVVELFID